MTAGPAQYDVNWENPLPHSLPPRRTYLSEPGPQTKCVLLLLHGRGDNSADFADIFVQTFKQALSDDARQLISIVALEARDTAWWPAHHEGELKQCLAGLSWQHLLTCLLLPQRPTMPLMTSMVHISGLPCTVYTKSSSV